MRKEEIENDNFLQNRNECYKIPGKIITTGKFAINCKLLNHPHNSETPGQESIPKSRWLCFLWITIKLWNLPWALQTIQSTAFDLKAPIDLGSGFHRNCLYVPPCLCQPKRSCQQALGVNTKG